MTPAEHRAEAESWIQAGKEAGGVTNPLMAVAHALLAQAPPPPPAEPAPKVDTKRSVFVQTVLGELLEISKHEVGLYIGCDTPDGDWSTLISDPTQVRLMADALTAHAQRMETNR